MHPREPRISLTDTESDSTDIRLRRSEKPGVAVERAGSNCKTEHEVSSVVKDADALDALGICHCYAEASSEESGCIRLCCRQLHCQISPQLHPHFFLRPSTVFIAASVSACTRMPSRATGEDIMRADLGLVFLDQAGHSSRLGQWRYSLHSACPDFSGIRLTDFAHRHDESQRLHYIQLCF